MPDATMMTVAVELDGTLAQYDGWKGHHIIGDPFPGAQAFIRCLQRRFHVVLYTARVADNLSSRRAKLAVENWLREHGFPPVAVYDGIGKPIASWYVDDRAVTLAPTVDTADADYARVLRVLIPDAEPDVPEATQ